MDRVVEFSIFHGLGIECHRSGGLPGWSEREDCASDSVAGISGNEDFVLVEGRVINNCQALMGDDNLFDGVKGKQCSGVQGGKCLRLGFSLSLFRISVW